MVIGYFERCQSYKNVVKYFFKCFFYQYSFFYQDEFFKYVYIYIVGI